MAEIDIARTANNKASCPPYTEMDATETRCQRVLSGFAEFMARKGGGRNTRFLNKNPHLWNKLPFLRAIFPDAALLITSRDIRSTVASAKLLWTELNEEWGKRYYFPKNPEHCWSVTPPAPPDEMEASRIFPGGDAVVLAEYWLYTYEMIERTIGGFDSPMVVKHHEFLSDPYGTLAKICKTLHLPSVNYPLPVELDMSRNDRWHRILTSREQGKLGTFIENNRFRIERLKYADTTL